jgi:hypothetical protein
MDIGMSDQNLTCREERRREDVREASLFGLDYVEVVDEQQLTLNVFFLGKAPAGIEKENVVLTGGRRIRDVKIDTVRVRRQADPTLDDYLEIQVTKPGDFSEYTISLVKTSSGKPTGEPMDGFDARYSKVRFSFKASCPTDLDCKPKCQCPPPRRVQPDIDYLAKDYESFRQLILDRLAILMPDWNESHVPDLGITLVELLAYAGDYLSYYQDAVATEAYLGTARQRISVRRHARLVDYLMHDGCNARAWLTIWTDVDQQLDPAEGFFVTAYPGAPVDRHVLALADLVGVDKTTYEVFEPLYWTGGATITVLKAHSRISFYTWGDCECCLPQGATSATLADSWVAPPAPPQPAQSLPSLGAASARAAPRGRALHLQVGDILVFEEVLGPHTGQTVDADPSHRQAVRLTKVTPGIDPLYGGPDGTPIVEIEWASEDALTFPLCISSRQPPPECGCLEDVSVARGNVILVDNGGDATDVLGPVPTDSAAPQCPKCCEPASVAISAGLFRPVLGQAPLTSTVPLPPACSAADFMRQDPRQALPWISLTSILPAPTCAGAADPAEPSPPCVMQPAFTFGDLVDPTGLARSLHPPADPNAQFLVSQLRPSTAQALTAWDGSLPLPPALAAALIGDLTSLLQTWSVKRDLLESAPSDCDFVVETDNDGHGHLRFGDTACGRQPDAGTLFRANYRVGNGTSGNVGAETIVYLVLRNEQLSGVNLLPRNPLPARGGTDPEPIDDVKLLAPYAFRSRLERAVTAADYAAIAGDNERRLESRSALEAEIASICAAPVTRLQGAKAALRWTGSWYTALVALDPLGRETTDAELIDEVTQYLQPFRRMGHELLVSHANYVPLKVSLTVCVLPDYLRGHVEAAVLDALSNRVLPSGALGFFHPDNLSFGDGVYVSRLLATVQAIPGVRNAMVTELERFELSEPSSGSDDDELPIHSVLYLGPFEIGQLDNDPDFPENGLLVLDVRGGR